jgi:hypothetical protein
MATQLDTIHSIGFDAIKNVGGETVSINGSTYNAVVGEIDQRDELAEGGVRQIRSVRFAIKSSSFSIVPSVWDRCAVRGQTLRIMSVSLDGAVAEFTAGGLAE